MKKFYAKFKESNFEFYVFNSRKERDDWVNYQDEFSRDMGTTPENAFFKRMVITAEEARAIAGESFNDENNYYIDEISNSMVVFFNPLLVAN